MSLLTWQKGREAVIADPFENAATYIRTYEHEFKDTNENESYSLCRIEQGDDVVVLTLGEVEAMIAYLNSVKTSMKGLK